ncbi:G-type lectin S-receptor-like serine/threonine-protein kinase At4g27290 isoform X2 [Camellia sinensis]|uniref:G-type lectin S-receptor-like serine/threonine-protein kinase At4g27290 isoform X2 n=1 Tax=Camellia sinensis TaxID=4442 RepID=UPI001035AC24|nr:G-type lectin S-receptor-like serine/threonine-protein kinase At4g27290 isoform X2 [Camellia sinensis]
MKRSDKTSMEEVCAVPSFFFTFFILIISINTTITKTHFISDGNTIVSSSGTFELGFFTPGADSKNRYVGIWYKKISTGTVVWVANRETPIPDKSGVLKIIDPRILVLVNGSNQTVWSTNSSISAQNPVARLLDSGNLVVNDEKNTKTEHLLLWQSFDYPGDTFLPGMKLGKNFVTGKEWYLSSWKSKVDPSQGAYTFLLDLHGYPQIVLSKGSTEQFRAGPWNGVGFSGPHLRHNPIYTNEVVFKNDEVYYSYELINSSIVSRLVLNPNGIAEQTTWIDRTHGWVQYVTAPQDPCDSFKLCGPYGICSIDTSPVCGCLSDKFVPKDSKNWDMADWSSGCVRMTPLDCHNDGFVKFSGIKIPDTRQSWYNTTMTLEECREVCLKNCSCTAYTNLDVRGSGSGCLLWFHDLIDLRVFSDNGLNVYIRMASSDVDQQVVYHGKKRTIIIVSLALFSWMLLFALSLAFYVRQKKKKLHLKKEERMDHNSGQLYPNKNQKKDLELPFFDLATIVDSTNYFSINNKIGEGGFGPVYKGILEGGQEIAVKRLSEYSTQGPNEFKNEVICIAKLQHRNLVKLLGCCNQGEEKMLIYEYMPNKSLDYFIFDQTQRTLLDWPKRFQIINGIARGILYLHQDSRLRIIHRDLKASNVLLDIGMNPKISDFGMARSFGGNETAGNTKRVVGTYGYMSPEYAFDGLFSIKSDAFSFGVLVLEIMSGKRNRGFYHPDHHHNLLGHAWILYKQDRSMELIDESLRDSCDLFEVLRSIHVGLLCVQQHPEDRPNMSTVVLMLGSEGVLPQPKQPGFFTERNLLEANCSLNKGTINSVNEMTISMFYAR